MTNVILYLISAALFLVIDAVMLSTFMGAHFRQYLGDALLDTPRLVPAAMFYLFYVFGLVVLVSAPALAARTPARAAWQGALLGAVAYGTYEWTNFATLDAWVWQMVVVDWAWGTVLTGTVAAAGVWATLKIRG